MTTPKPPSPRQLQRLQDIERGLLQSIGKLNLRPTLERAYEIGALLNEAKKILPHGDYLPFVRRVGLTSSSAHDYASVNRFADEANIRRAGNISIKQFLETIRKASKAARLEQRQDNRREMTKVEGDLPPQISLHHSDCREFDWPDGIDVIATDPPWEDADAFKWLGEMAFAKLKKGGLRWCSPAPETCPR